MRKIVSLIHMTLDGFAAGLNGEMDSIVYNDEVEQESHTLHARTDSAIYGRITFDMMNWYWPRVLSDPDNTSDAKTPGAQAHARWYDAATKYVFSRTLTDVPRNTVVVGGDDSAIFEAITRIKQQPGKDIWLLGSPSIAQLLTRLGLIDEYRININPVVLGGGIPYFRDSGVKHALKLTEVRTLKGGVVAARYVPA
jgi:dihydrofolate reductase